MLLRNLEVFRRWAGLGLSYMFLGIEAIDATGLDLYRKRVSPDDSFRALEAARRLGITVAINLIVDPAWDAAQFRLIREFAATVPEIPAPARGPGRRPATAVHHTRPAASRHQ